MTVTWTDTKTVEVPTHSFTWDDVDVPEHCGDPMVLVGYWTYPPVMQSPPDTTASLDFRCRRCFERVTVSSHAEAVFVNHTKE